MNEESQMKDSKNYSFFCHKECEYFPCHKTDDPDNFNCLFCYCPLYALGDQCGGNFQYMESGVKDCSNCLLPHRRESYPYITGRYGELKELAARGKATERTATERTATERTATEQAASEHNGGAVNMCRSPLLMKILKLRRAVSYKHQKYLSTPREYFPGERMYMREVHVVMEIGRHGIDNVGELSERLNITKGAVSQYLKKLEEKGFVSRIQDRNDKRQFSVKLTKKGQDLYRIHNAYDKKLYARACPIFSGFMEEDLERILRFDEKFKKFSDQIMTKEKDEF